MESDKTEAHTANYTFLELGVSDSSHSMTPAGDKWHAGLGAISKARVSFQLSTDTPASGCDSQKMKTEEMLKFPPIHTLKSEKLSVSSASSESPSILVHHQTQNLILLPAVHIPPQVTPPSRFHVDPCSPPPSKHKLDY